MHVRSLGALGLCALAALVAVACSADGLWATTCNDEHCCLQSCCNEAFHWCRCSSDGDCATSDQPFCVDGRCASSPASPSPPEPPTCTPACGPSHPCPDGFACGDAGTCVEAFAPCGDGGLARCDVSSRCEDGRCVPTCSDFSPCDPRLACMDGGCRLPPPALPVCGADAGADAGATLDAGDAADAPDGG